MGGPFSTSADVDIHVLRNMETLFRYPGTHQTGLAAALAIYRRELSIFHPSDLARGWRRIIRTHKSPWWPTIAALLSACRAEYLHRMFSDRARRLAPGARRPWSALRKRLFLTAASSGFSGKSVTEALGQADQWLAEASSKEH